MEKNLQWISKEKKYVEVAGEISEHTEEECLIKFLEKCIKEINAQHI